MTNNYLKISLSVFLFIFVLASCSNRTHFESITAPGAPGSEPYWSYSGKTGIGTSFEKYDSTGAYSENSVTGKVSKVWFSLANGILTETMYGLIHVAQIKEMQFILVGNGFVDYELTHTTSHIEYLYNDETGRPLSLAYKVVNTDIEGKYEIEKHYFTNPDENTLFVRAIFRAFEKGITPYLYVNPHVNNTGVNDKAWVTSKSLHASEGNTHVTVLANRKFEATSAGFVGASDGLEQLEQLGELVNRYNSTGDEDGNVAMIAALKPISLKGNTYDFVIGFGESEAESVNAAKTTLKTGYNKVLSHYNGAGDNIGWSDYLSGLSELDKLSVISTDGGKLLYASAMVLKAQEDKTHAGALIASLSNPWGETVTAVEPATGYKGVWPRDFYQCAMAKLALGDTETPLVAFEYLKKIQVRDETPGNKGVNGWFLQKTQVDGQIEWVSVQLDQTAMPIMLGWRLWKMGVLTDERANYWYIEMLKPAADFLVNGGTVDLDWNRNTINPPATQEERWEEQSGFSPSTTAAIITGLVCASDFALLAGDFKSAESYLAAADRYEQSIEKKMFTTKGAHASGDGNGKYFIRITANDDPNDRDRLKDNNGRPGLDETKILDAGFLELVRYGVRAANHWSILESLPELDDITIDENLRVKYLFSFDGDTSTYPGWRRYGNDGYGEDEANGDNYGRMTPGQRGRVWPFFTGERGHYELARSIELGENNSEDLRNRYVKAMEYFANEGLMIPEQVWDGIGVNKGNYKYGEGTNSATPLAWSHAEYVKLLRSVADRQVWDRYYNVEKRYQLSDQ